MTLGKSLNTSDKISTWDQDPSYNVKARNQTGNLYRHLLMRVQSFFPREKKKKKDLDGLFSMDKAAGTHIVLVV